MKKSFSLALIALLYFVATDAQTTSYLWAINGSTSGDNAAGEFVAPMPDGGCVSAGEYSLSGLRFIGTGKLSFACNEQAHFCLKKIHRNQIGFGQTEFRRLRMVKD